MASSSTSKIFIYQQLALKGVKVAAGCCHTATRAPGEGPVKTARELRQVEDPSLLNLVGRTTGAGKCALPEVSYWATTCQAKHEPSRRSGVGPGLSAEHRLPLLGGASR
ncbi:MAG: hypothetical protein NVS3B25_30060 [Hymenobacter sp.]